MKTDEELIAALAQLGGTSAGSDANAFAATRSATLAAVDKKQWGLMQRLRLWQIFGPAATGAAAGVILAVGWAAPPGSPLHGIENVREQISASFAGDQKAAVLLGFAEERIGEAQKGQNVQAALSEANGFLNQVVSLHPAPNTTVAKRLATDLELLQKLMDEDTEKSSGSSPQVAPPSPSSDGRGATESGDGSSGSTGTSGASTSGGSDGGSGGGSGGGPSPTSGSSSGGGGPSPTSGSSSGGGGGSDGGSGGTQTSTSSSGGGGGGG